VSDTSRPRTLAPARPVAVIGGGWAGCAAALKLASRGARVVLHEAAPVLGGRARRVERAGLPIDNGQHLLVGAYGATLALLRVLHAGDADAGVTRQPLTIAPFGRAAGPTLVAPALPPPWNLVAAVLRARGLAWGERIDTLRWLRRLRDDAWARPAGETVDAMLAGLPRAVARRVFAPLAVAALNTPSDRASAAIFATLLCDIAQGRGGSDFLLPKLDLSELLPEPAARRIEERGGEVRLKSAARVVSASDDRVVIDCPEGEWTASAAIVAVGPHQLVRAFGDEAAALPGVARAVALAGRLGHEPTTTIWLGFRERVRIATRIARLDDRPGHWIVERRDVLERAPEAARARGLDGMVAVVISAGGPHDVLDAQALAGQVQAQLKRLDPSFPTAVWSQVIAERRATWSCVPGTERPRAGALAPRIALAGDYTDPRLPATLEAAVLSGERAARAIAESLRAGR